MSLPIAIVAQGDASVFRGNINNNFNVTATYNESFTSSSQSIPVSVPNAVGQFCLVSLYSSTSKKLFQCTSYTNSTTYTWTDISSMIDLSKIDSPVLNNLTLTGTITIPVNNSLTVNGTSTLVSPVLTGVPTTPTAVFGTNTTQIATTAFVQTAIKYAVGYGTCASAATDTTKAVTVSNYAPLFQGAFLAVTFTNGNTVDGFSISVNSGTAYAARYSRAAIPSYMVQHSSNIFLFMFDGTYWQLANPERTTVISGTTAPSNTGALWIDTTTNTGGLKYYTSGTWTSVPVDYVE